eukprot:scaffold24116_cov17-Tisochrysis_lutea.AAC.1
MAGAMIDAVTAVAWAWHSHSRTTMNGTVVAGAMNGTATAGAKAWQSHSKALPIDGRACSASFEHQTLFWISLISFCLRFVTHALLCARKTQVGYDFVKEAYSVSSCRDYKPGEEVLCFDTVHSLKVKTSAPRQTSYKTRNSNTAVAGSLMEN